MSSKARVRIVASQLDYTEMNTITRAISEVARLSATTLDAEFATVIEPVTTFKSSVDSVKFRTMGNEAFHSKQHLKSLVLYDYSISHAQANSPELALAFANRSAVLKAMGKLTDCFVDIQRALNCGYPETLKYKLLLREAQCLRDLGQSTRATATFNFAIKALNSSEESATTKQSLKSHILDEKKANSSKVQEINRVFNPTLIRYVSYGHSDEVPCVSRALKLNYDNKNGRHYVAGRNIKVGDVLLVEEPFVVKPQFVVGDVNVHCCTHCHKICFNLLPCPNCSWALFCSDECLSEAAKQYHTIECSVISRFLLLDSDMIEFGALAIRCMAKAGVENARKYVKLLPTSNHRARGLNSRGKYVSTDILTILNLESNFSKHSLKEKLNYCIVALEMAKCFNSEIRLDLASLLLHFYLSSKYNSIAMLFATFQSDGSYLIDNKVGVGGALYPALSLVNHSCYPNTVAVIYGNKVVLRALHPISQGTQVTFTYIFPYWPVNGKLSRQASLKDRYKFECKCEVCCGKWPDFDDLSEVLPPDNRGMDGKLLNFYASPYLNQAHSLLNDRKALIQFVDQSIIETSQLIYAHGQQHEIPDWHLISFKQQLYRLFVCSGTVITGIMN